MGCVVSNAFITFERKWFERLCMSAIKFDNGVLHVSIQKLTILHLDLLILVTIN